MLRDYGLIRILSGIIGLALVLVVARPADATVGGPKVVEVLGWDARDAKLYFVVHDYSESGNPPLLHFINAASGKTSVVRSWYSEAERKARPIDSRLETLKARLEALPQSWGSMAWESVVSERTEGERRGLPEIRFEIQFSARHGALSFARTYTAYFDPAVRPVAVFALPDTELVVAVIRYRALWHEGGYDVDDVVVIGQ